MYVSIDLVEEIIERQLKKYKNKLVDQKQSSNFFKQEYIEKEYMEDEEVKIIRSKKFDIKPMYPEDACIQMELLGHNSSYSVMQRQNRSMWFTSGREILTG